MFISIYSYFIRRLSFGWFPVFFCTFFQINYAIIVSRNGEIAIRILDNKCYAACNERIDFPAQIRK